MALLELGIGPDDLQMSVLTSTALSFSPWNGIGVFSKIPGTG